MTPPLSGRRPAPPTDPGTGSCRPVPRPAEASRPFGKLIKPEDVARLIAFLGGAESAPMTGSCVEFEQTVVGAGGGGLATGYPVKKS